jgi:hypothetical protein
MEVVVVSRLQNAIELRLYDMVEGEHIGFSQNVSGTPTARRNGDGVHVKPGRNRIDGEFWRKWFEANKTGGFVINELIVAEAQQQE